MRYAYLILLAFFLSVSGCQNRVKPEPLGAMFHKNPQEALAHLTKSLGQQVLAMNFPDVKNIPVDEFFNESSAEVAVSGKTFQQQLAVMLSKEASPLNFSVLNRKNIETAQWVVLASYAPVKEANAEQPGAWIKLRVALAEVGSGTQLAKAETYLQASQFQSDPTRFFKDAPMYLTDQQHKERIDILNGKARPLGATLKIQAAFAEAVSAYEDGQLTEAEEAFQAIIKQVPNHQGALTGIYQSLWQQGKKGPAEAAFVNLVSVGVESGKISVRILFKVNSTDYIDSADLAQQYKLWLKGLGQVISTKSKCLNVTGHASKSGNADYNDKLSLQRANKILGTMQQATPGLNGKTKAYGKGFQETIVGTGANDASDSIDRRVEFGVTTC